MLKKGINGFHAHEAVDGCWPWSKEEGSKGPKECNPFKRVPLRVLPNSSPLQRALVLEGRTFGLPFQTSRKQRI